MTEKEGRILRLPGGFRGGQEREAGVRAMQVMGCLVTVARAILVMVVQVTGCPVTVARAIRVMVVQVTECLVTVVRAIRVWAVRAMVVRVHGLIQGRDR